MCVCICVYFCFGLNKRFYRTHWVKPQRSLEMSSSEFQIYYGSGEGEFASVGGVTSPPKDSGHAMAAAASTPAETFMISRPGKQQGGARSPSPAKRIRFPTIRAVRPLAIIPMDERKEALKAIIDQMNADQEFMLVLRDAIVTLNDGAVNAAGQMGQWQG